MPAATASSPLLQDDLPVTQPKKRSKYDMAKLAFNVLGLTLVSTLAISDGLRAFLVAQPKFDETGNALRGFCNPVSPSHAQFTETCANLTIGEVAAKSLTNPNQPVVRFNGTIDQAIANAETAKYQSIFFQKFWFSTIACALIGENSLQIVGSAYNGGREAREKAITGFPVYNQTMDVSPNFIIADRKTDVMAAIAVSALAVCQMIRNGAEHASNIGQYTNGFESSFTSTFEKYSYAILAFSALAAYACATNMISTARTLFFSAPTTTMPIETNDPTAAPQAPTPV